MKNWRGMSESAGRRIKRSIYIDVNSIRFCDQEMLDDFRKIRFINQYIEKKRAELDAYHLEQKIDIQASFVRLINDQCIVLLQETISLRLC